jgi:hypothetical protein
MQARLGRRALDAAALVALARLGLTGPTRPSGRIIRRA